jgi:DNA polymerase III delta subunit
VAKREYLTRQEFEKLLTNRRGELPPAVLFYGDPFYLEEYRRRFKGELEKKGEVISLYYDEIDLERVKEIVTQPSLFGGGESLILLHNRFPSGLVEIAKGVKGKKLLFFYTGKEKGVEKKFPTAVRFFEPTLPELEQFLQRESQKLNLHLSPEIIQLLLERVEPLLYRQELEKLALYPEPLTLEIAKELIFPYREESFEHLFNRLLRGENLWGEIEKLLEYTPPHRLAISFIYHLRELLRVYLYIRETGESRLEKLYGYRLPPQIERERIETALSLKREEYLNLLETLLQLELKIRQGKARRETLLPLFFTLGEKKGSGFKTL